MEKEIGKNLAMLSQATFNFKDKKLLAIIKFLFYNGKH